MENININITTVYVREREITKEKEEKTHFCDENAHYNMSMCVCVCVCAWKSVRIQFKDCEKWIGICANMMWMLKGKKSGRVTKFKEAISAQT